MQEQDLLLNPEQVNLSELISECIEMQHLKAEKKGVELSLIRENSQTDDISIETDGNRLRQIIVNLISNSIKYT